MWCRRVLHGVLRRQTCGAGGGRRGDLRARTALVALTGHELIDLDRRELDELFRASPAGGIPAGDTAGTALLGSRHAGVSRTAARAVGRLVWKGKVFDRERGELLNKVTPFAVRAVRARVYVAASRLDGREAIVLDYSKTSLLARSVRDEIREVAPGVYLGLAFWRGRTVVRFALTTGSPPER
jgi:hypothetical protein